MVQRLTKPHPRSPVVQVDSSSAQQDILCHLLVSSPAAWYRPHCDGDKVLVTRLKHKIIWSNINVLMPAMMYAADAGYCYASSGQTSCDAADALCFWQAARLLVLLEHTIQILLGPRVPRLVEMLMRRIYWSIWILCILNRSIQSNRMQSWSLSGIFRTNFL